MKVAIAQLNLIIADLDGAAAAIRESAQQAKAAGAQMLVFPELAMVGGYPPRDLLERPWFVQQQWELLQKVAKGLPLPCIVGCVEPLEPGMGPNLANAVAVLERGEVRATYHKRLLPTYDVFDEGRYFRPGSDPCVLTIAGVRVGLTVCEDIWNQAFVDGEIGIGLRYHQDPVGDLAEHCDVIVNCSASPYHLGKSEVRRRVVGGVARRAQVPVIYANQVGGQDDLLFDGDSGAALPDGRWLAAVPRWQTGVGVIDIPTGLQPVSPTAHLLRTPPADHDGDSADLHAALVLGIRDYCAKTKQNRVVLGLSGGIDSALVAALAVDALGKDAVIGLLMPGPYSSPGSISDAEDLAKILGIRTHLVPISAVNAAVLAELQPIFAGIPSGVAEENLQSRLRGVMVMAVANKLHAMALTTGNKSELATGYCTIYGDMNGGLAPIGDLYKTQVWDLARWINAQAGAERIPTASITKVPSAELRENQTDQDSLPPYEVLDRILKRYLDEGWSPDRIVQCGDDAALVQRIVRLVELNEFKRRQAAPNLRVSVKAFGTGRRFPLARKF